MHAYGNDTGLRIARTLLTHNVLAWKSQTMVNYDADEGIDIEELYRNVNGYTKKC